MVSFKIQLALVTMRKPLLTVICQLTKIPKVSVETTTCNTFAVFNRLDGNDIIIQSSYFDPKSATSKKEFLLGNTQIRNIRTENFFLIKKIAFSCDEVLQTFDTCETILISFTFIRSLMISGILQQIGVHDDLIKNLEKRCKIAQVVLSNT